MMATEEQVAYAKARRQREKIENFFWVVVVISTIVMGAWAIGALAGR
jgi:hypothetical protein